MAGNVFLHRSEVVTLLQICTAFIHLFIFPLLILVGLKCSGNRLRWSAKTSLSIATYPSLSWGIPKCSKVKYEAPVVTGSSFYSLSKGILLALHLIPTLHSAGGHSVHRSIGILSRVVLMFT